MATFPRWIERLRVLKRLRRLETIAMRIPQHTSAGGDPPHKHFITLVTDDENEQLRKIRGRP